MSDVMESVDVAVPVRTAYDQWTQFEEFPRFMDDVDRVEQVDPTRLHWIATIDGVHEEWDAAITEQQPDERIAWRAVGKGMAGIVSFQPLGQESTRVSVRMSWQPEGTAEKVGAALGIDASHVRQDLARFKDLVERQRVATGGWRGEVVAGERVGDDRPPASPATPSTTTDTTLRDDQDRVPARPDVPGTPPTW
jgi:uncharacterized membrane protein